MRRTKVRISNVAVRAIGLDHHTLDWDLPNDLTVFLGLHRAAINAKEKVKFADRLHLCQISREAMHDTGWEPVSILS